MSIRITGLSPLLLFAFFACQPHGQAQHTKGQSECTISKFNKLDSIGVFTSKVALWDKPSPMISYRGLWLADSINDTVIVRVDSLLTQNIIEEKLHVGRCVTVTYRTEVVEEDGIELNRFFHAIRLDYP